MTKYHKTPSTGYKPGPD